MLMVGRSLVVLAAGRHTGDQTRAQSQTSRCSDRVHRVLLIQMKTVSNYFSAWLPGFINSIR
jgi:hypothetical protein